MMEETAGWGRGSFTRSLSAFFLIQEIDIGMGTEESVLVKRRYIFKWFVGIMMFGGGCAPRSANKKQATMEYLIDETLKIVKAHSNPETALADLIALCAGVLPNEHWIALPKLDVTRDVEQATKWLTEQMSQADGPSGICLGLDSLNMDDGKGSNIAFASSKECDPSSDSQDWLEKEMEDGEEHLIHGLYLLQKEYGGGKWSDEGRNLCDYILFLGYSGIVLMHAFQRISITRPTLAVWGFHDGDLFRLAHKDGEILTRICEI